MSSPTKLEEAKVDLEKRFAYHPPKNEGTVELHEFVRHSAKTFATRLVNEVPDGRERNLALTKIEEAMFWANAAVARSAE